MLPKWMFHDLLQSSHTMNGFPFKMDICNFNFESLWYSIETKKSFCFIHPTRWIKFIPTRKVNHHAQEVVFMHVITCCKMCLWWRGSCTMLFLDDLWNKLLQLLHKPQVKLSPIKSPSYGLVCYQMPLNKLLN